MKKHKFGKIVAVGALFILVFMGVFPSVEAVVSVKSTIQVNKLESKLIKSLDRDDEPIPHIEGVLGDNNWYISEVTITFSYNPELVQEIQYRIIDNWVTYTGPFDVIDDGVYSIAWRWIDLNGKTNYGLEIKFKIDKSPPEITLTKDSWTQNSITFLATTQDLVSGIEYVEFYLDDELIRTDDTDPYDYTWTGEEVHHEVYAISYNLAGLSEQSETLNTKSLNLNQQQNIFNIIYQIIQFWQNLNL